MVKTKYYPQNQDDFAFTHFRDGVKIFIGDFRQNEFFNLLEKIKDGAFDQITTGEIWCVEDLLNGYKENINSMEE